MLRRGAALSGLIEQSDGDVEGVVDGPVIGTHWHGLLENDGFRRALLRRAAEHAGRAGFVAASDTDFAAERAAQLDLLGDLVERHLDTAALQRVIEYGAGPGLPVVRTGLVDLRS